MMWALFLAIIMVPAIECEPDNFWSNFIPKIPSITLPPPEDLEYLKDFVSLIPQKTSSSPQELEDFVKGLEGIFLPPNTTPLRNGEYLRKDQCQYTCKETGGCSTQLVVDWATVTNNWEANTYSECASSSNNGKCRERVTSCEDCNKVIDCEKENAAENGVEKLVASKCSISGSIGSDQEEARVFCFDVCSGQDNCKCGTMVYKHGKEIHEEELNEYGVSCGSHNAEGVPLTELTALAGTANLPSYYRYGLTTRDSDSCSPIQCRRGNKCCEVFARREGASICPASC